MYKTLTQQQQDFVDALFLLNRADYESNNQMAREAAKIAGYSSNTDLNKILESVKEAVVEKTESYLVSNAPLAAKCLVDALDKSHVRGINNLLAAAGMILDRGGIVKKERLEVESNKPISIVLIPTKNEK